MRTLCGAWIKLCVGRVSQYVCDIYAKRVKRVLSEWKPEKETIAVLQKYGLIIE
jgi:hypothetical protein